MDSAGLLFNILKQKNKKANNYFEDIALGDRTEVSSLTKVFRHLFLYNYLCCMNLQKRVSHIK